MATFRYVGEPGRYYPDLGVTAEPGVEVELPEAPADGRWAAVPARDVITRDVPAETPRKRPAAAKENK